MTTRKPASGVALGLGHRNYAIPAAAKPLQRFLTGARGACSDRVRLKLAFFLIFCGLSQSFLLFCPQPRPSRPSCSGPWAVTSPALLKVLAFMRPMQVDKSPASLYTRRLI